jgi:hypothetical protein
LLAAVRAVSSTTLFTAPAHAQQAEGSFTLPYAVYWGAAMLPAGKYTFAAPSSIEPFILTVRGERTTIMIMAQGRSLLAGDRSSLLITREGNQAKVSSLQLALYGLRFEYGSRHRRPVQEEASNRPSGNLGQLPQMPIAQAGVIDIPHNVRQ